MKRGAVNAEEVASRFPKPQFATIQERRFGGTLLGLDVYLPY